MKLTPELLQLALTLACDHYPVHPSELDANEMRKTTGFLYKVRCVAWSAVRQVTNCTLVDLAEVASYKSHSGIQSGISLADPMIASAIARELDRRMGSRDYYGGHELIRRGTVYGAHTPDGITLRTWQEADECYWRAIARVGGVTGQTVLGERHTTKESALDAAIGDMRRELRKLGGAAASLQLLARCSTVAA